MGGRADERGERTCQGNRRLLPLRVGPVVCCYSQGLGERKPCLWGAGSQAAFGKTLADPMLKRVAAEVCC